MNKYNKLKVIEEYKTRTKAGVSQRRLKCLCDCGNMTDVEKAKAVSGVTKSCGCVQEEIRKNLGKIRMLPIGQSSVNQVFEVYKKSATARGYEFLLSKDEFVRIATQPCIYCGKSLTNELLRDGANGSFKYTGIDRYDNSIGYTLDNSVPCCSVCNRVKTNMKIDFMYEHISKMLENSHLWRRTS